MTANKVAGIILEKHVPQGTLLDLKDFVNFAGERGIKIQDLERKTFEFWDRKKLLRPVLKVRSLSSRHLITKKNVHSITYDPAPLNRALKKGEEATILYDHWSYETDLLEDLRKNKNRVINLESRWFHDWKHFLDARDQVRITYWYHPFQILRLRRILRQCEFHIRFPDFKSFPLNRTVKQFYKRLPKVFSAAQESEASFLKELALMVAIEDRYLPEIRGQFHHRVISDDWQFFANTFHCNAVLEKTGFSIDEVRKVLDNLVWEWQCLNEVGDWHVLIRHAGHEARNELKGNSRLAWDVYEYAEMVRLFLKDATCNPQPSIETMASYGVLGRIAKRQSLEPADVLIPALLRQFQIDPRYRILIAVEGEAEEAFIKTWAKLHCFNLKKLGVKICPFFGTKGLKSRHFLRELQHAKESDALVFLSVDDENDARNSLESLKAQKLIEEVHPLSKLRKKGDFPVGAFVWKPCFEDANFSPKQLAKAWLAAQDNTSQGKDLTADEHALMKRMHERQRTAGTWIGALLQVAPKSNVTKVLIATELAKMCREWDCDFTRFLRNAIAHAS